MPTSGEEEARRGMQDLAIHSEHGYGMAKVFLCYFPGEDNFAKETEDLAQVFQKVYHFDTWLYEIPIAQSDATQAFLQQLEEWIESADKRDIDTLRIFYYCGHASIEDSDLMLSMQRCTSDCHETHATLVNFSKCKLVLQQASGKKCALLDCCFAASAAFDPNCSDCDFEVLAAYGFAKTTHDGTFTPRLIEELQKRKDDAITLAEINANMVRDHLNKKLLTATPWHGVIGSRQNLIALRPLERQDFPKTVKRARQRATKRKSRG